MEPTRARRGADQSELWRVGLGGPLERLKNAAKSKHTTTGICDLVPSFEGLPGAQNQHLESADSRGDLLKNV